MPKHHKRDQGTMANSIKVFPVSYGSMSWTILRRRRDKKEWQIWRMKTESAWKSIMTALNHTRGKTLWVIAPVPQPREKPLRSRRGENVCREILWIPQRPLYLNANIKVCSGLCGFLWQSNLLSGVKNLCACLWNVREEGGALACWFEPTEKGKKSTRCSIKSGIPVLPPPGCHMSSAWHDMREMEDWLCKHDLWPLVYPTFHRSDS